MNNLGLAIINKSREFRSKKFLKLGKFFLRIGINANLMTFFSFTLGILMVYFLFTNHGLFILFLILHLLADGLDGVIAKASHESKFGHLLDHFSDRIIAFLVLLRIGIYLEDYYVYLIIGLFLLTQLIYLINRYHYPVLFIRSTTIIILAFNFYPLNNLLNLPVIAYLTAGVLSAYSLMLQLQYYLQNLKKDY